MEKKKTVIKKELQKVEQVEPDGDLLEFENNEKKDENNGEEKEEKFQLITLIDGTFSLMLSNLYHIR